MSAHEKKFSEWVESQEDEKFSKWVEKNITNRDALNSSDFEWRKSYKGELVRPFVEKMEEKYKVNTKRFNVFERIMKTRSFDESIDDFKKLFRMLRTDSRVQVIERAYLLQKKNFLRIIRHWVKPTAEFSELYFDYVAEDGFIGHSLLEKGTKRNPKLDKIMFSANTDHELLFMAAARSGENLANYLLTEVFEHQESVYFWFKNLIKWFGEFEQYEDGERDRAIKFFVEKLGMDVAHPGFFAGIVCIPAPASNDLVDFFLKKGANPNDRKNDLSSSVFTSIVHQYYDRNRPRRPFEMIRAMLEMNTNPNDFVGNTLSPFARAMMEKDEQMFLAMYAKGGLVEEAFINIQIFLNRYPTFMQPTDPEIDVLTEINAFVENAMKKLTLSERSTSVIYRNRNQKELDFLKQNYLREYSKRRLTRMSEKEIDAVIYGRSFRKKEKEESDEEEEEEEEEEKQVASSSLSSTKRSREEEETGSQKKQKESIDSFHESLLSLSLQ